MAGGMACSHPRLTGATRERAHSVLQPTLAFPPVTSWNWCQILIDRPPFREQVKLLLVDGFQVALGIAEGSC